MVQRTGKKGFFSPMAITLSTARAYIGRVRGRPVSRCAPRTHNDLLDHFMDMVVGLAGFEPATFRPPDGRATKLRHSPNTSCSYAFCRQEQEANAILIPRGI